MTYSMRHFSFCKVRHDVLVLCRVKHEIFCNNSHNDLKKIAKMLGIIMLKVRGAYGGACGFG